MIVRIWRGEASAEHAPAYRQFVTQHVFTAIARIDGHRGAYLLQRDLAGHVEFLAVTLWESLESIRAFAGDEIETAVVEPEARAVLSSFDDFVRHYEVAFGTACGDKK
ncbi:MAG: antibiotic biosynthesis monooxygenase [Rhodospirillaceae bacterium]